jgi:hypothetical protein
MYIIRSSIPRRVYVCYYKSRVAGTTVKAKDRGSSDFCFRFRVETIREESFQSTPAVVTPRTCTVCTYHTHMHFSVGRIVRTAVGTIRTRGCIAYTSRYIRVLWYTHYYNIMCRYEIMCPILVCNDREIFSRFKKEIINKRTPYITIIIIIIFIIKMCVCACTEREREILLLYSDVRTRV